MYYVHVLKSELSDYTHWLINYLYQVQGLRILRFIFQNCERLFVVSVSVWLVHDMSTLCHLQIVRYLRIAIHVSPTCTVHSTVRTLLCCTFFSYCTSICTLVQYVHCACALYRRSSAASTRCRRSTKCTSWCGSTCPRRSRLMRRRQRRTRRWTQLAKGCTSRATHSSSPSPSYAYIFAVHVAILYYIHVQCS